MRILITKFWSDRNRGDSAIGVATAQLLRRSFPNSELYGMSYFGANQSDLVQSESFNIRNHVHSVVGGLFPTHTRYEPRSALRARIHLRLLTYLSFIFALTFLPFVKIDWFTKTAFREFGRSLELFKTADLVVVKGGSHIKGARGFGSLYLFRELYPALLAVVLKKPFMLLGHSIWDIDKTPSKHLFRFVARRATLITLRDEISFENLKKIGTTENVRILPDLAFFLKMNSLRPKFKQLSRQKLRVGITVRRWGAPHDRFIYLTCIRNFIKFLIREYKATVIIIPHTRGPSIIEDDLPESKRLYLLFQRQDLAGVHLIEEELSMEKLFDLYSSLDILVGTRFHSVIFAVLCGVPAMAISYSSPKALGIMRMLGLERFCVDISNIELKDLIRRFADLERSRPTIRSQIEAFLSGLSDESEIYERLVRDTWCYSNRAFLQRETGM